MPSKSRSPANRGTTLITPGRDIRLIDSIMNYAAEQHIPGLLLFIDFEKSF